MDNLDIDYTKVAEFEPLKAKLARMDALTDGDDAKLSRIAYQALARIAEVQVKETPLTIAERAVPVLTNTGDLTSAGSILLATGTPIGEAKAVANPSDDLPRVDVDVSPRAVQLLTVGASYGLSIVNMQNGWGVTRGSKSTSTKRSIERKLAQIGLWGDKKYSLDGVYTTNYAMKENLSIERDNVLQALNTAVNMFRIGNEYTYEPTHILLPQSLYSLLTGTFKGNNETVPLLKSLKDTFPFLEVVPNADKRAGDDGKGKIVVANFDDEQIRHRIPRQFTQIPDQARNLEIVVNCYAITAGIEVVDKRSIMRIDYQLE